MLSILQQFSETRNETNEQIEIVSDNAKSHSEVVCVVYPDRIRKMRRPSLSTFSGRSQATNEIVPTSRWQSLPDIGSKNTRPLSGNEWDEGGSLKKEMVTATLSPRMPRRQKSLEGMDMDMLKQKSAPSKSTPPKTRYNEITDTLRKPKRKDSIDDSEQEPMLSII
jgi:hypothetical protein